MVGGGLIEQSSGQIKFNEIIILLSFRLWSPDGQKRLEP